MNKLEQNKHLLDGLNNGFKENKDNEIVLKEIDANSQAIDGVELVGGNETNGDQNGFIAKIDPIDLTNSECLSMTKSPVKNESEKENFVAKFEANGIEFTSIVLK